MPKIVDYSAPVSGKANLSDRAISAWEAAARRVGPLHNEAAQEIALAGHVRAEMERSKIWPFNIAALYEHNAPHITRSTSSSSRTSTTQDVFHDTRQPTPINPPEPEQDPHVDEYGDWDWSRGHGEASVGAALISQMARAAVAGGDGSTISRGSGDQRSGKPGRDANGDGSGGQRSGKPGRDANGDAVNRLPMVEGEYYDPNAHGPNYYDGSSNTTNVNGIEYTPYQMDQIDHHNSEVINKKKMEQEQTNEFWQRKLDKWNDADYKAGQDFSRRRDAAAFERDNPGISINGKFDPSQASDYREQAWQKEYDADQKRQDKAVRAQLKDNPSLDEGKLRQAEYEKEHVFSTGYKAPDRPEPYHSSDFNRWAVGAVNSTLNAVSSAGRTVNGIYSTENVVAAAKDTFKSVFGDVDTDEVKDRLRNMFGKDDR